MFNEIFQFFKENLVIISILNIGVFLGFIAAIIFVFSKLPKNYWICSQVDQESSLKMKVLRNILAFPVAILGALMLLLPGQGLLTLLLALMLADFELKQELMAKIIAKKKIRESLDYIRRKMGRSPFIWPE